jgi:hypothetical protein
MYLDLFYLDFSDKLLKLSDKNNGCGDRHNVEEGTSFSIYIFCMMEVTCEKAERIRIKIYTPMGKGNHFTH